MIFLIDHNLKGHALVFLGAIATQGWLDIVPIQFVTFAEMDLSSDSDDRTVWRLAQENQMIVFPFFPAWAILIAEAKRLKKRLRRSQ